MELWGYLRLALNEGQVSWTVFEISREESKERGQQGRGSGFKDRSTASNSVPVAKTVWQAFETVTLDICNT